MRLDKVSSNIRLLKEWHPSKNLSLSPDKISLGSNIYVWWLCGQGHEWQVQVYNRHYGYNCPYCSGLLPTALSNLAVTCPEVIKEWHPKNTKNINEVAPKSIKLYWWICPKGHEYESSPAIRSMGCGCTYCNGKKASKDNNLESIYPLDAKEWHPTKNGVLLPINVLPHSNKKYYWMCSNGHEYLKSVNLKVKEKIPCPYCSNSKACKENCLQTTHPEIAKLWHPTKNGTLTPEDVTFGSSLHVWWVCKNGHEHKAKISNKIRWLGCKKCSPFIMQTKCKQIFEEIFQTTFASQRPKWLINPKTKRRLELDGYNENLKLAFEYDGRQHSEPFRNTNRHKAQFIQLQYRDSIKNEICKLKGVTLIRIPFTIKYNNLSTFIIDNLFNLGAYNTLINTQLKEMIMTVTIVQTHFKTSDLYFAAFLKTADFDLSDIITEGNRKFFVFKADKAMLNKVQTEYINGKAKVVAKDLIDNLRNLKTLTNAG